MRRSAALQLPHLNDDGCGDRSTGRFFWASSLFITPLGSFMCAKIHLLWGLCVCLWIRVVVQRRLFAFPCVCGRKCDGGNLNDVDGLRRWYKGVSYLIYLFIFESRRPDT